MQNPMREDILNSEADIFEGKMDAVLRRVPEVRVPLHFRNRLLAQIPEPSRKAPERRWTPLLMALLLGLILAGAAAVSMRLGLSTWMVKPYVLAAALAAETVVSVAWLWRAFTVSR
jgi:hypothetical protein